MMMGQKVAGSNFGTGQVSIPEWHEMKYILLRYFGIMNHVVMLAQKFIITLATPFVALCINSNTLVCEPLQLQHLLATN
jgi:hypothetical protein